MKLSSKEKLIVSLMREWGLVGTPRAFLAAVDAWRELEHVDPDLPTPHEATLISDQMGEDASNATRAVALDALRTGGAAALQRLAKSALTRRAHREPTPPTAAQIADVARLRRRGARVG